ncbi:MAG TPA: hypothetical protein VK509_21200, partial [Polyangiales bacterium]|nr:hypothetical protein [Polyangiales bacterium]
GAELWVMPFTAQSTDCAGQRYGWSGDWEDFFDGQLALAADHESNLYVANSRLVAKLGGTP